MLVILITIMHVLVCFFLILVVLAQQGKGQDLASAFGGTGSQTAFGARGTATLLSKITAGAAVLFMITSLSLSYLKPAVTSDTVVPATTVPGAVGEKPPEAENEPTPPESEAAPDTEDETEPETEESEQPPPPQDPS